MRIEFDLANRFGQRALYAHCVRSHYTNIIVTYQRNSGRVFSISRACRRVRLRRACYTKCTMALVLVFFAVLFLWMYNRTCQLRRLNQERREQKERDKSRRRRINFYLSSIARWKQHLLRRRALRY